RAAGSRGAEDQADGGDALGRAARDLAEALPAGHEGLRLERQGGAARLGEVDDRQAVLLADLHGATGLLDAVGIEGSAAHGGLVRGEDALDPRHHADAGDDAAAQTELGSPRRQRRDLEERRVAVEEQLDALAGHQLPAPAMALDVPRTAAGPRQRELLVQVGDLLEEGGAVRSVRVRAWVHVRTQDIHQPSDSSSIRRGCRPFAWPMKGGCTLYPSSACTRDDILRACSLGTDRQ